MNKNMKLVTHKYPRMIQTFSEENFNLKTLTGISLSLVFLCLIVIAYLVKKGPTVIALDASGEVTKIESKITDLQIQAAAKEYLAYRYSWDDKSISGNLKKAEFFVRSDLIANFQRSMTETIKYVREKKVRQRIYPKSISVDLKEKSISIIADRITEFDNLKAATEFKVKLWFEVDSRSIINPWGVYITKELESGGTQ